MSAPSPVGRARVFVDSSAYYALTDTDEHVTHRPAQTILARLGTERAHLFTSNFVVAETHALLLSRLGRDTAFRFLQRLDRGSTTVVRVGASDERRAREIIARYDDKAFSLTDATSFAVMERLRIGSAFSFDRHFTQYGLHVLTT